MREWKPLASALATALAITTLPAAGVAQASGTYTLSGDDVAVYNLAGIVRIVAGSGADVQVAINGGGADADRLEVETGPVLGRASLRVLYPGDRIVYPELHRGSRTQMRVRDDGTFGDRNDRGGRGSRITIAGSGSGLEAWADLTVSVPRGRAVSLYLGVGEVTAENVEGDLLIDVSSAPVRTTRTVGRLSIDTGSGSVEVRGATGPTSIDTGSGSVDVFAVRGDVLTVDTGSGGVDGGDIQVRELHIDTGSGGIDIADAAFTDGLLDTGSGGVRLELTSDVNDLSIDTGSGGVTIVFPAELGAGLDLDTGSGGIDFDVPIRVSRFGRRSLQGEIGDGRGMIRIETGSGSIRFVER